MKKMFVLCAMIVACASLTTFAGVVYSGADGTAAFTVQNVGTGVTTIRVDQVSGAVTNYTDGVMTTLTGTARDTITELVAGLNGCTNRYGQTTLKLDASLSLGSDATAGLLQGEYIIQPGATANILWDTSACKFYGGYIPIGNLTSVTCLASGSGAMTLKVWESGSLIYNAPIDTNSVGVINKEWAAGLGTAGRTIVRVVLESSATTGNISLGYKRRAD